ncbi:MAG: A/G-specific adenine glycosylase [Agathobaculum sp.]|uniref:A/G-specific adenine glycosylase n=1 Tax=Agathobaculum sp. TaxID=2048138 RepID=UPI0025BA5B47|nr:A/G-specific adenine glycosylase [Agathobaculum sp.]MCI7125682.1 A/G-specific adenine glycosylase [Agathobaculum sp.]MDY3711141.1 A/G-specific adenine glycosylase [Agathobaculum sp.]
MSGVCSALAAPLLAWYDSGHRDLPWRASPTPYHVWVSEIMLQQTRVEAVRGYYTRWMEALPSVRALAEAEERVYLKLWEGLGYYSRVRNLHRAAVEVCARYGGALPADYEQLRALPGIGEYTAGAIASIAFGLPVPAVDGNVLRVAARLDGDFTPITDAKYKKAVRQRFTALMPADRPGDFNQALMELGATVCLPNGAPLCSGCPVQHLCLGYHHGSAAALPIRAAKKARRIEPRTVLLPRCDGLVGLCRRPPNGLLAGLWELPSLDGHLAPDEVRDALAARGWQVDKLLSLRPSKHIFTHVEWHMTGYYVELSQPPDGLTFVTPSVLRTAYALPSAFRAFLSVIEEEA